MHFHQQRYFQRRSRLDEKLPVRGFLVFFRCLKIVLFTFLFIIFFCNKYLQTGNVKNNVIKKDLFLTRHLSLIITNF